MAEPHVPSTRPVKTPQPVKSWRDLDRDGLIYLIEHGHNLIHPKDVLWAQWNVMSTRANRNMQAAADAIRDLDPIDSHAKRQLWFAQQKRFDDAMRDAMRADAFFEAHIQTNR